MFALKSGNFSVSFFNGIFFIGQFFSIEISNILTLFFPNGTLSRAPGASNLLYKDLATSRSGEIITSIGIFDLLYNLPHFPSKKSFVRSYTCNFFETLNKELANWQTIIFVFVIPCNSNNHISFISSSIF